MISRRDLIKRVAGGLALAALGIPSIAKAKTKANLKFSMWGDTGSTPAYKHVVEKYQAANPGVQVDIQVIPYGQYYQQLDTSITGGQPADLMRFEYQTVGRYAQSSVLLNLSDHFDKNIADDYLPAFWQPVHSANGLFAIPQNTDTFGIFYNKSIFQAAGIVPPTDIAKSWTWAEFTEVAQKLLSLKKTPFAFAMDGAQGPLIGHWFSSTSITPTFSVRTRNRLSWDRKNQSKRLPGYSPGSRKEWSRPIHP